MPSAKACNKIKDPKKRAQCKSYSGPYAKGKLRKGGYRVMDNIGKKSRNGVKAVVRRNNDGY